MAAAYATMLIAITAGALALFILLRGRGDGDVGVL